MIMTTHDEMVDMLTTALWGATDDPHKVATLAISRLFGSNDGQKLALQALKDRAVLIKHPIVSGAWKETPLAQF